MLVSNDSTVLIAFIRPRWPMNLRYTVVESQQRRVYGRTEAKVMVGNSLYIHVYVIVTVVVVVVVAVVIVS